MGTFDGVHRGHQTVLRCARRLPGPVTVLTFDPHPRTALGERVGLLGDLARREQLLREHGADDVHVLRFDRSFAAQSPEQFIESTLRPLGATHVVGGAGFRFGRARSGDAETLRAHGLDVSVVPIEPGISSSSIRSLLAAGDVAGAGCALGREPELDVRLDGDRPGEPGSSVQAAGARPLRLADEALLVPAPGAYRARCDGRDVTLVVEAGGSAPRLWAHGLGSSARPGDRLALTLVAPRRESVRQSETALSERPVRQ